MAGRKEAGQGFVLSNCLSLPHPPRYKVKLCRYFIDSLQHLKYLLGGGKIGVASAVSSGTAVNISLPLPHFQYPTSCQLIVPFGTDFLCLKV